MAKRIAKYESRRILRISIFLPLAVSLVAACHWSSAGSSEVNSAGSSAGKLPASSSVQTSVPANANAAESSPALATATPALAVSFSEADFARHIAALEGEVKKKAGPAEFSYITQKPFVVIGDETKQAVQQHAEGTVKWAVDRLKLDFFTNDPKEILDIWLFKDAASYEKHARLLFGETPTTPYGYYSSHHKALIMNIETGGGTLVHEIVHPFMEANFPACPPWLNEGLGSLYEQCGDVNGHIHGFTNWRLPGLQRSIKSGNLPSFKTLTAMDSKAFYNEDKGTNYAQARYLCYYLQEKGLLVKFYQEFLTHQKEDPGGFNTLQKILAERDMDAFKTKWEKYVLGLRQGYSVTVE
jgi:hypothetical protein